jgi:hypothetical protein
MAVPARRGPRPRCSSKYPSGAGRVARVKSALVLTGKNARLFTSSSHTSETTLRLREARWLSHQRSRARNNPLNLSPLPTGLSFGAHSAWGEKTTATRPASRSPIARWRRRPVGSSPGRPGVKARAGASPPRPPSRCRNAAGGRAKPPPSQQEGRKRVHRSDTKGSRQPTARRSGSDIDAAAAAQAAALGKMQKTPHRNRRA